MHVNPFAVGSGFFDLHSDASGYSAELVPVPDVPALAGLELAVQAFWYWPSCTPSKSGGSTSRGLRVTIQAP